MTWSFSRCLGALALAGMLGAASDVSAQYVEKHVSGEKVAKRTTIVVHKERWERDLDALKATAQKEKKLVFWMQLVGELGGGL